MVIEEGIAQAPFKISRRRWKRLLAELVRRGEDRRESGAFLLSDREANTVTAIAFYDDSDGECLTGGISFASSGFTELWGICRTRNLRVVADIHTHPSRWVMQSEIDATNPMIARVGHVAIIVPDYGRAGSLQDCGAHIYLGSRQWQRVPADRIVSVVRVYDMFSRTQLAEWATGFPRRIRQMLGNQK